MTFISVTIRRTKIRAWAAWALATSSGCAGSLPSVNEDEGSSSSASTAGSTVESTGGSSSSTSDTATTSSVDSTTTAGSSTSTTGIDDPPRARNDGPYPVRADHPLQIDAGEGVLANDQDPEGSALTVVAYDTMSVEGGTVTVLPDGSFSYQPPVGLPYGTDRFTYAAEDELGQSATAEVRVAVQPAGATVGLGAMGSKGVRFDGIDDTDITGRTVSGAGDVNGDGYADLLFGARNADVNGNQDAGESYIVYGGPELDPIVSLADADVLIEGIDAFDGSGAIVSGAGDVNGDGYADVLISAYPANPEGSEPILAGECYLVYGGPALPSIVSLADLGGNGVRFGGIDPGDNAGLGLDGVGDVNGDGYADILIGAYQADLLVGSDAGESYLVYGGPSLSPFMSLAEADVRFEGAFGQDGTGWPVNRAGDVNGDGYADLLIGAFQADPNDELQAGTTYLVHGGSTLPAVVDLSDPMASVRLEGIHPYDHSGFASKGIGDTNGDGYADIVVGEWSFWSFDAGDIGETYLVHGNPGFEPTVSLAEADVVLLGIDPSDRVGAAMGDAGDFNGDGYKDLLIGAPWADLVGDDRVGETYLVLGTMSQAASTSLADADVRFVGIDPTDESGWGMAGAGDVDGDGFDDILIGAWQADPNGVGQAGETYLLFGDDLDAEATILGTPGDDELVAEEPVAAHVIIGGRGDDVLQSEGWTDVLRGGAGDDTIRIVDDAFFRIDGGLGTDTLELAGGVLLPLAALAPARVAGIERIQLGLDGPSSITLSELAIVNLSDTSNALVIEGDEDDIVVLESGTWLGPWQVDRYELYTSQSTAAQLLISSSIPLP